MKSKVTLTPARISLLITIYLLFFMALFSGQIQAQTTYYTLTPGDWNNTTIWSLDGTTPCFCRPSKTLDTFDIEIRNDVVVNQPIDISNGSSLIFSGISGLAGATSITNTSGTIKINGTTVINGLELRNFNMFQITGALSFTGANMNNRGMIFNEGDLLINSVNFTNDVSATMHLVEGSNTTLTNGLFRNLGALFLDNVCFDMQGSNMENVLASPTGRTGGRVFGNGGISLTGNLYNESTWENTVAWCANGTDQGMRHPENCSGVCSTLPVDFLSVSASTLESPELGGVLIEWATLREQNNSFFTVETGTDGESFEEIFRINSDGDTETGNSYGYHDQYPASGRNFYRIKQTDQDGSSSYSTTVEVFVEETPSTHFICYPNPTQGQFNVQYDAFEAEQVQGKILNMNGQIVQEFEYAAQPGLQNFPVNMDAQPAGMYLVQLFTPNTIQTVKMVKGK